MNQMCNIEVIGIFFGFSENNVTLQHIKYCLYLDSLHEAIEDAWM